MKYIIEEKTTKQIAPYIFGGYPEINTKHSEFSPSFFVGYNIGIRVGKNVPPGKKTLSINELRKNSLFYEFLGNGFFGSINYERVLFSKNLFCFTARAGLGYLPFTSDRSVYLFPLLLINNQIRLSNCCSFEAGLGIRFNLTSFNMALHNYTPDLVSQFCFRYNSPRGFLFRAGVTPVIFPENEKGFFGLIQPGISFGYSFNGKK